MENNQSSSEGKKPRNYHDPVHYHILAFLFALLHFLGAFVFFKGRASIDITEDMAGKIGLAVTTWEED